MLDQDIRYLKGVGEKRAELFAERGILTVKDLLFNFPRVYEDRSHIKAVSEIDPCIHEKVTLLVHVVSHQVIHTRNKRSLLKVLLSDGSGSIVLNFFNRQQIKYTLKLFEPARRLFVTGMPHFDARYGELSLNGFDCEFLDPDENEKGSSIHANRIVPVYTEFETIKTRFLRTLIFRALESVSEIRETFPQTVLNTYNLLSLPSALKQIHFPGSFALQTRARERLAFDRLFFLSLFLLIRKRKIRERSKVFKYKKDLLGKQLISVLPFQLTAEQKRVFEMIRQDLESPRAMYRLLQGDVGSGKTVVALLALLRAVENGYQCALMAPTEILAEQHFKSISRFLDPLRQKAVLLTGKISASERKDILEQIASGSIGIIIGTHALIREDVRFASLTLVVIDEQHKFGVEQRKALVEKGIGQTADLLVMTATPIPRTLSLTVYGDLDLSVIRRLPPGRKPIRTLWLRDSPSSDLYEQIRVRLEKGEKAYFIYPLVEESEKLELKNAVQMFENLQKGALSGYPLGLIHGRMKRQDKESVMASFRKGNIRVLVSTTVVEVGVDVPDATLIVIEHAERFGLAQLHQLRGRIGRGTKPSTCILVSSNHLTEDGLKRMKVMTRVSNGFTLAEKDLEIRGPGEFLGTRQSGIPDLRPADILKDVFLLEKARSCAADLLDKKFDITERERYHLYHAYQQEVKEKYTLLTAG